MYQMLQDITVVTITLKTHTHTALCGVPVTATDRINVAADRFGIRFAGRMQAVTDKYLALRCPSLAARADKLKGYGVDINYAYEDADWFFTADILGSDDNGNILVTVPGRIRRQERNDVRLFCRFPITIDAIDGRECGNRYHGLDKTFIIRDLSAGGLGLECPVPKDTQLETWQERTETSEVDVEFILPGTTRLIRARAAVTWANHVGNRYEIGIRFLNMSAAHQAYIVQYIYQEQIREKKLKESKNTVV